MLTLLGQFFRLRFHRLRVAKLSGPEGSRAGNQTCYQARRTNSQHRFFPAVECCVARDLSCVLIRAGRRLGLAAAWPRARLHLYSRFAAELSLYAGLFRAARGFRIRARGDALVFLRGHWPALGSQEISRDEAPQSLRNPADHHFAVGIRTRKAGNARPDYDHPGYAVFFLQVFKIRERELLPIFPIGYFQIPLPGKIREHRDSRCVLFIVGQRAALGISSETIVILTRCMHVSGIKRKKRRSWRGVTRPDESLHPGTAWRATWPFDVIARWKLESLEVKHCERERDKKRNPTEGLAAQQILAEHSPAKQQKHNVGEKNGR